MGILRLSFALFLALCLSVLGGCNRQPAVQAKQQETGPIAIKVASVVARDIQRVVEAVGTFFPYDESVISAEVDGRIDDVRVDLGDRVDAGQVLVHISDEEQRYLVAQNEAQLRQAMERLGLKNEHERIQDVREASEVRRAQADLLDAEQRFKRARSLVDQGIMSQSELDAAQARYSSAQAAYDSALNQARNMIQAIEQFRAQLELQRKRLRDTSVRAPYNGYVKERSVNVGVVVRANTQLLTLVRLDPIRLRIEVPERMAPWIRNGQTAQVSVEAFENRTFQGKVWRISPTVDQTKRTFVVEALIENPKGELKPGSYARARLPTQKTERIKLVPARAVAYVYGSNKTYVVQNNVVDAREVKLGDRFGDDVEILTGIEEGEQIATTQLNRLDTGIKVRIGP